MVPYEISLSFGIFPGNARCKDILDACGCSISGDGNFIVCGSMDQKLKLWNIETGESIKTFRGHCDCVKCCSLSSEDSFIVSDSWDKTLKLWNIET